MDPFVAEIRIFPFSFAPKGWAMCNGQLLPIAQNTALFSLLGTMYGGDGRSTFALPNLQGSLVVQTGTGQGLQTWSQGEIQGSDSVTLLQSEMPMHNHGLIATGSTASTPTASSTAQFGNAFAGSPRSPVVANMYSTGSPNQPLALQSLTPTGGNQPHNNLMPYLVLNYCIALQGVFPPRP